MRLTRNTIIHVFRLLSLYIIWQDTFNEGTSESTDPKQQLASDLLSLVAHLTSIAVIRHDQHDADKLTKIALLLLPTMAVLSGMCYVWPCEMSLTTAAPALYVTFLDLCYIISRGTRLDGTFLIALQLESLIMQLLVSTSHPQECSPKTFEPFLENIPKGKKQEIIKLFNGSFDKKTLKKAYRILSLLFHPDKGGSQEKMTALNVAMKGCRKI